MINEVFVIEIDKNGQILALDCGCLEIFFYFYFFSKPGRLVDYTSANCVSGGYTVFTLSIRLFVRPSVRPSATFWFFNILKRQ